MNGYVSPIVHSFSALLKNPDFQIYQNALAEEKEAILRELSAAETEKDLFVVRGKYKMLRKIMGLPEDTINKFLAQEKK